MASRRAIGSALETPDSGVHEEIVVQVELEHAMGHPRERNGQTPGPSLLTRTDTSHGGRFRVWLKIVLVSPWRRMACGSRERNHRN